MLECWSVEDRQGCSVSRKTVYRRVTTNCCFMRDIRLSVRSVLVGYVDYVQNCWFFFFVEC